MGLVVSNYSDTMQQAMFVMFFFIMIFLLMSGLLTPVASMPDWAQYITIFNPLKYFISVMRMVYLKGSGFAELVPSMRGRYWGIGRGFEYYLLVFREDLK